MKRNLAVKARLDKIMADTKYARKSEEIKKKNTNREETVTEKKMEKVKENQKEQIGASDYFDKVEIQNIHSFEDQDVIAPEPIEESEGNESSFDFSPGSSDDYIPNSESDTSTDSLPKHAKTRKIEHLSKKIVFSSPDLSDEQDSSNNMTREKNVDADKNLQDQDKINPIDIDGMSPGDESVSLLDLESDSNLKSQLLKETPNNPKQQDTGFSDTNIDVTGNLPENLPENQNLIESTNNTTNNNKPTEEDNVDQEITGPEKRKKKKQRISLKERREARTARLIQRNAGKSYVTSLGKLKPGRNLVPLKNCRMKCNTRITHEVREYIFKEYWNLGSYDERAKYVERLIKIQKKKTSKVGSMRPRQVSNSYKLIYFTDEFDVCKGCFLKTLGESNRFVQTICEKIKTYGRLPKSERGRAASYKKISIDRLNEAEIHILRFPAYESHYSRAKSSKKYLSPDLSLDTMYNLYVIDNDNPVSKTVYSKVFKDLNLSFKKPIIDTCNKCNIFNMKLKFSTDPDEKNHINAQLTQHQKISQMAYDEKRNDKSLAQTSKETCVIAFDLQQCLPTPMLNTQSAFYKRQLWVFNLTIHDFMTNNAYCYMWPESSGGRGANQIATCLYDFIITRLPLLYPEAKNLIMYSDSCSGQNKNSIVATALMLAVKESEQLESIQHKFLIPGHTHMEVDSDHALIERARKRTSMNLHHPRDWCQLVRSASKRNNKFSVIEMSENDFYDFAKFIKQHLMIKKINATGQKFVWSNVRIMKFSKRQFPCFEYKENFNVQEYFTMSYSKRNKDYNMICLNAVEKCYNGPVPISVQKKKDLISLLEYIDPSVHDFYHELVTKSDLRDVDPDIELSEEDD